MINQNQFLPFPYFYNHIDLQHYFWLQSTRNNLFYPQNIFYQCQEQRENKHFQAKSQENQQVDTQKLQSISSQSQLTGKKEIFLCTQATIGLKDELKQQKKDAEGSIVQRNETKNISKNFGKAILSFAKTNSKFSKKLLKRYNVEKQALINYIKKARKDLNSLQDLRQMWGADDEGDNLKKCLRIISNHFMRKHCLTYIFNSRIKSLSAHTKYRHRLMEGMSKPSEFKNIKMN